MSYENTIKSHKIPINPYKSNQIRYFSSPFHQHETSSKLHRNRRLHSIAEAPQSRLVDGLRNENIKSKISGKRILPIGPMVLVYMLWGYIDGIHVTIYIIHGSYGLYLYIYNKMGYI